MPVNRNSRRLEKRESSCYTLGKKISFAREILKKKEIIIIIIIICISTILFETPSVKRNVVKACLMQLSNGKIVSYLRRGNIRRQETWKKFIYSLMN